MKNSKIYVPARFILEIFEEDVKWDSNNRVIIVSNYSDSNLKLGELQEFRTDDFRLSLQLSEKFKENIGYKIKENSVVFFDRYNKEKSNDKSSETLYRIIKSTQPVSLTVPAIVLDFKDGVYIEAVM